MKKDYLEKAINYSKQITTLDDDDYTIIDDLEDKLTTLGIETSRVTIRPPSKRVSSTSAVSVPRSIGLVVPAIAQDIYKWFMGGKLIYKPDKNSTNGQLLVGFTVVGHTNIS